MTITVPSNYTPHVDVAQVLVEQLAAVGITAQLQEVEWNTWLQDVYQNRKFQSTVVGFDASTLTANAMLQRWMSDSDKNMINFSDAQYDQVMSEANATTDDADRTALYLQAEKDFDRTGGERIPAGSGGHGGYPQKFDGLPVLPALCAGSVRYQLGAVNSKRVLRNCIHRNMKEREAGR